MTVLAWDYFLVYQIKDIRNGKTSSRLWKVLAFLSVKHQKEAQKFARVFPPMEKREKKKKRTLPVFDTQNCFFFFFF